jgi:hypothetical protein
MTPDDDLPTGPVILSCTHRWDPGDPAPVLLWHVVPLGGGWGVASGSMCRDCAAADREGMRSGEDAWAAARAR